MTNVKHGFTLWKKKGVRFFTIPSFDRAGGAVCAISTRIGGVSPKPYDTLNFSRSREKNEENFLSNFERYSNAAGFDYKKAVANKYEHGDNVIVVSGKEAGKGVVKDELEVYCDGLITKEPDLALITYHADCVPLFFYDPKLKAAAICHAGWKGISLHIINKTVDKLEGLGCKRSDILTAVGPCISVKHFEVQSDVFEVYEEVFGQDVLQQRQGRVFVDLPKACLLDMLSSGIQEENITLSELCTYEHKRLFYSHRRDKGCTGAMAAVIMLKDNI